jgi:hypothetical protein
LVAPNREQIIHLRQIAVVANVIRDGIGLQLRLRILHVYGFGRKQRNGGTGHLKTEVTVDWTPGPRIKQEPASPAIQPMFVMC